LEERNAYVTNVDEGDILYMRVLARGIEVTGTE
jgi:hypothetical protein